MVDLTLADVGGVELNVKEMISDELIGFIDGLNPKLGTKNDPYHDEYQAFLMEMSNAGVVTIDPESISSGRFDDVDLSGAEEETRDIPDNHFVDMDMTDMNTLMLAALCSPFNGEEVDGYVFSNVYATPFGDYVDTSI